ncbi:MAG: hypothetical protein H6707_21230 [Deltaproteobacteria bacterium]|nr:hypothetical protein [Planctomycetales bacterium]MCB9558654.1 hypothetical protein [Deltaproteobacteria bacterium]
MRANYPTIKALEIKKATFNQPISQSECNQWVSQFSATHTLLRDNGSALSGLNGKTYDVLILDRQLKVVWRSYPLYSSSIQAQARAELDKLVQ